MLKRIGFDVDGVLADFGSAFLDELKAEYGANFVPDGYQPHTWEWKDLISADQFGHIWRKINKTKDWWLGLKPLPGLKQLFHTMTQGKLAGTEILFISSRGESAGHSAMYQTEQWLERYLQMIPRVMVVSHAAEKRDLVRALGIGYFLDDYAPTILNIKDVTKAYLLEQPWNSLDRSSYNMKSVPSVDEFIKRVISI